MLLLYFVVTGSGCSPAAQHEADPPSEVQPLRLQPVLTRLPQITSIAHAGDGSGRLFLTAQRGQVLELRDGRLQDMPLLDLGERVRCCGEQGLLGLAFDPRFRDNGLFYVSYTDQEGTSVIARYRSKYPGQPVDPASGETVLRVAQPTAIHNGGAIVFGPDRMLYIALGDGGHFDSSANDGPNQSPDSSGTDPHGNAQSRATLLGKILRVDVSAGLPYRVPAGNPFAHAPGARAEIWAYGLRNPWRMSFDRENGDLFIADVGRSRGEEVNRMPAGTAGSNFGWSIILGLECVAGFGCDAAAYTAPILAYDHELGCAIIGGYRYRGAAIASLRGIYLFGDFCRGILWGGRELSGGRWTKYRLLDTGLHIGTFGEDEAGEVYVAHYSAEEGALYRLEPAAASHR